MLKRIATDFESEKDVIRSKFTKAEFPSRFTERVIRDFSNKVDDLQPGQESEEKTLYRNKLLFCECYEKIM